jgi:hypothetical protein
MGFISSCQKQPRLPPQAMKLRPLVIQTLWRTSTSEGSCDLPPKILPMQARLTIGVGSRLNVTLPEGAPLSDWPGVQVLEG